MKTYNERSAKYAARIQDISDEFAYRELIRAAIEAKPSLAKSRWELNMKARNKPEWLVFVWGCVEEDIHSKAAPLLPMMREQIIDDPEMAPQMIALLEKEIARWKRELKIK